MHAIRLFFATMMLLTLPAGLAAANPFAPFSGTWKGPATVEFEGGKKERYSCVSYNNAKADGSFTIALRCASGSARFELRSAITRSGSRLSGQWEDRTYNNSGTVSGSVSDNLLDARISGSAVSASVKVRRDGGTLHIDAAFTKALKSITVAMNK